MNTGGFNQQMMQANAGGRGNFRNQRPQQRGQSHNGMVNQVQNPMAQHMMAQQQMMGQSMMSPGVSQASYSTAPLNASQQFVNQYQQEIQSMFMSHEFKNSDSHDKKELVGNTIYKYVEKIVGENKAPKITGMLIDLPETELNYSVSQWNHFYTKVQSAYALIQESEGLAPGGAQSSPSQKVSSH